MTLTSKDMTHENILFGVQQVCTESQKITHLRHKETKISSSVIQLLAQLFERNSIELTLKFFISPLFKNYLWRPTKQLANIQPTFLSKN